MTNTYNLLQSVQWDKVGIVIGIFAAIAVLLIICILLVSKFCKITVDETVEKVLSNLAGANCGGCGCSGCAGFAEKLCKGEAKLSDCHVTEAANKAIIAQTLGLPFTKTRPTVSVVHCGGGDNARDAFVYIGAKDCSEAKKLNGGAKACKYGCFGDGNCASVCPQDTICVEHQRAAVNPDFCISCGACMTACPNKLLDRIPQDAKVYIACSNHDKGKAVMDVCKVGCIACGKCAKTCPHGAITMVDNLPVIDYDKCVNCGKCAEACPRKTIKTRY